MRILITGSQTWPYPEVIRAELVRAAYGDDPSFKRVTLVSGNCPKGADRQAEEIAEEFGWAIERHPADWDRYGKRAGFVRNAEMVEKGADVCLAFVHNDSKGATMTADLADKASIPTRRIRLFV